MGVLFILKEIAARAHQNSRTWAISGLGSSSLEIDYFRFPRRDLPECRGLRRRRPL